MRNKIIAIIFLIFIILTLFVCRTKRFDNKDVYNLKVGEEFQIYGTTNSCCCFKLCNPSALKHLNYVGDEIVENHGNCAGCSYTEAEKFRAISVGTDTVILAITVACNDCDKNGMNNKKYIINIE